LASTTAKPFIICIFYKNDQIQTSYKTLKGVRTFVVTVLTAVGAWFGLINNK